VADVSTQPEQFPAPADPAAPGPLPPRRIAVLCVLAGAVGLLAGLGASVFVWVEHELQLLLWTDLPEALGQPEAAGWLAVAIVCTGAVLVHLAHRLPGHAGHAPLDGFGLDIGPREVGSVLVAALASLSFGAVLGPEAPLMAVGTALGALAFRERANPVRAVMMLAGAMAAVGAIFGNPLITAILLLEFATVAAARGGRAAQLATPPVLMAALSALASGYLLQVGLESWSGLGEAQLGLPGLPPYPDVYLIDLVVAVPLAIVVALVTLLARVVAEGVDRYAARSPLPTLLVAGVVIALSAVAVRAITGGSLDLVLFSGQAAMPDYLALTSVATALVILVGKFVAYAASLGSGFRGGAIFPAVALGTLLATAAALLVEGTSVSALAATAIAAATAAMMRMPFLATLLAVTLTYPAGGATTVTAILGMLVGMLTRLAAEQRFPRLAPRVHAD
jgi:H+/Cl- antiporter ClcA